MLLCRLALRLGRTLKELDETLGLDELRTWEIFDLIEPIGDRRFDTLASMVASMASGAFSGKPIPSSSLLPKWSTWIDEMPLTPEEESERTLALIIGIASRAKIPLTFERQIIG